MFEDELRSSVFAVIINITTDDTAAPKRGVPARGQAGSKKEEDDDKVEHPLYYRLGLHELTRHELYPNCAWRLKHFEIDCSRLDGESDPKFTPVIHWVREKLDDERCHHLST